MAAVCIALLLWMTPHLWGTQRPATEVSLAPQTAPEPPAVVEEPSETSDETKEEFPKELFLGTWQSNPDGRLRTVTNHEDGTATIHVKLDYLGAFFYGSELNMDCKWRIEDGCLIHECVGGTPEKNVANLTRDLGATTKFEIVQTSDNLMELKDLLHHVGLVYEWKRVEK